MIECNDRYYPVMDRPTREELKVLGIHESFDSFSTISNPFNPGRLGIVGVKANERRKPLAGEWFLSGDSVFKAGYDYNREYEIVRLVVVETKLRVTEVSFHRTQQLTKDK